MLSAAHDIILEKFSSGNKPTSNSTTNLRGCNELSTGAILLADIVPSLIVKFTVPFLPFYINFRMAACVITQIVGFLCVSYSNIQWLTIVGVALTSFSSGLGEVTLMSHCHKYHRENIVAWSSGTGGAGIIGSFSYAGLRTIVSTDQTLLIMLVVPILEAIAFWIIIAKPNNDTIVRHGMSSQEQIISTPKKTIKEKFKLLPGLVAFIVPLTLVYLFEYFINQGIHELVQFDNIWLNHAEQYRWLQADYQIGVFISRSSAIFFSFKRVWLMAVFQLLNVVVFTTEAIFFYIPSIWIVFAFTFWEGLLGGGAYVNTYYNMADTVPSENLRESLGIVTMSDAIGITIAGWLAMPVHTAICKLPRPIR
ncbi:hypothetical protein PV327_008587 [Microctonus hyperodae]|uniref:Battenin n=1 Tax=Microctonus hyperodae TaxID=165561 RepID=A0AA39KHI2_MICHY|nr:hypothetical protein PV327_008587 [Microctonus hyperodae]